MPNNNSEEIEELTRAIREDVIPLAEIMEEAFGRAAKTIEEEMAKAAKSGSLSFKAMVEEILNDLARLAAEELVRQPLEQAILQILGGEGQGASAPPSSTQLSDTLAAMIQRAGRNG